MLLPNHPFENSFDNDHNQGLTRDNEGGENTNVDTDKNGTVTSESRSSHSPVPPERKYVESDDEETGDDRRGDGEEDREEDDPELAALLQMNSDMSSSSDAEDEREGELKGQEQGEWKTKVKGKSKKGRYAYEMPASTIAVLIVACWTLRIPVMYRDFTRWDRFFLDYHGTYAIENRLIEAYELPYLDPVSRKLLPANMVAHLTRHNIQALSPYVRHPTWSLLNGLNSALAACTDYHDATRSSLATVEKDVFDLWNFHTRSQRRTHLVACRITGFREHTYVFTGTDAYDAMNYCSHTLYAYKTSLTHPVPKIGRHV